MALRFRPAPTDRQSLRFGVRPRPMRPMVHLLVLVGLLVIVLAAMRHVSNPAHWAWMGLDPQRSRAKGTEAGATDPFGPASQANEFMLPSNRSAKQDSDVRVEGQPPAGGPPAPAGQAAPRADSGAFSLRAGRATDVATGTRFWERIYRELEPFERRQWYDAVRRAAGMSGESGIDAASHAELIHRLDALCRAEFAAMLASAAALGEDQRPEQLALSEQLFVRQRQWEDTYRPVLESAATGATGAAEQVREAKAWLQLIETIAWNQVRDRAPLGRRDETLAWHLVEDVISSTALAGEGGAPGGPAAVRQIQLLSQPAVYRGREVWFSGTVRRAQRLGSGPDAGMSGPYYELWIQPDEMARVPYCVWVLQWPAAAPAVGDEAVELHLPVRVAGRFFKVRVYATADGGAECPFLVARTVEIVEPKDEAETPAIRWNAAWILVPVLIAAGVVWIATRGSGRSRRAGRRDSEEKQGTPSAAGESLDWLRQERDIEPPGERLRHMSQSRDAP